MGYDAYIIIIAQKNIVPNNFLDNVAVFKKLGIIIFAKETKYNGVI